MAADLTTVQAQFALDLMRAASDRDKDAFLSPVSIAIALAMTYAGVEGETRRQMNHVMFGDLADDEIHTSFAELRKWLAEPKDGYHLLAANRLYAQKDLTLVPDFLDILSKHYRSELHPVDFKTNADNVATEINSWVSETTKNRINDLLAPGVLDPMTRLVLINAIYFKGDWLNQFEEQHTQQTVFHSAPNNDKQVDMMFMKKKFLYAEDADVQVLGMPYQGEDLHMFAFLPKEQQGLAVFEKGLTGERLLGYIRSAHKSEVEVHFPKFKLEKSFQLNDALKQLGMSDLFDPEKADLSKITGGKDLHVSAVIHKAFIEVNEKGSEAAAATAAVMGLRCAPMLPADPIVFYADHPFIFVIGNREGHLLFLGRYV